MKKIKLILFLIIIYSCNGNKTNNSLEWDALSKIAYGNAKFGMTKNEVINLDIFKGGEEGDNYINSFKKDSIGKFTYSIQARFFNDSLFMIEIYSNSTSEEYIETELKNYAINLKDEITSKHGEPNETERSFSNRNPKKSDFVHATVVSMYGWHIKDKQVGIFLMKKSDNNYIAVASIGQSSMAKRVYARK